MCHGPNILPPTGLAPTLPKPSNGRLGRVTVVFVSSWLLGGCSAFGHCPDERCAQDQAISANVSAQFGRYPSLSTNALRIQTRNRVVYVTGLVDTDVERLLAVSVADDVPDVKRVVD